MNPTPVPREDDELIGHILAAAEKAERSVKGRSLEEVLAAPEARETLQRCAAEMGDAAREISEMMRNWATHISWESLIALREESRAAGDDAAVRAVWSFLREQLPGIRSALEEMWQPPPQRRA
jgi:glycine C-acetyltransferase